MPRWYYAFDRTEISCPDPWTPVPHDNGGRRGKLVCKFDVGTIDSPRITHWYLSSVHESISEPSPPSEPSAIGTSAPLFGRKLGHGDSTKDLTPAPSSGRSVAHRIRVRCADFLHRSSSSRRLRTHIRCWNYPGGGRPEQVRRWPRTNTSPSRPDRSTPQRPRQPTRATTRTFAIRRRRLPGRGPGAGRHPVRPGVQRLPGHAVDARMRPRWSGSRVCYRGIWISHPGTMHRADEPAHEWVSQRRLSIR